MSPDNFCVTLSSIEREMVALLSMSAETIDELSGMFASEDEEKLRAFGDQTVRDGVTAVLNRLELLKVVQKKYDESSNKWWWLLTEDGKNLAEK